MLFLLDIHVQVDTQIFFKLYEVHLPACKKNINYIYIYEAMLKSIQLAEKIHKYFAKLVPASPHMHTHLHIR